MSMMTPGRGISHLGKINCNIAETPTLIKYSVLPDWKLLKVIGWW